jgi:hypothetical protein
MPSSGASLQARRLLRIELVQLGLQQQLLRQSRHVFGDEGWRQRPAERIFDDFRVLGRAQQDADRRTLVRFLDVAIQRLKVELELPDVLWLELADFQMLTAAG